MRILFASLLGLTLTACGSSSDPEPDSSSQAPDVQPSQPDVSQYVCGNSDHPSVGQMAILETRAHGVAGQVLIKDNCTLEVTSFSYDGGGPTVLFYGGKDGKFGSDDGGFAIGEKLNGTVYNNATLTVTLESTDALDKMNSISVWCADFDVSFGDGQFM